MKITIKETVYALIIAAVLAALDLFVFPARLFINLGMADIGPIYTTLIFNQVFLIVLGLIAIRYLCPNLTLGLKKIGAKVGLKRFLPSAVLFTLIAGGAYYIGLLGQYDYTPTVWKILVEVVFYNFTVGFIEELYVRGLLLNSLDRLFSKRKNSAFIAIIISSFIFSLGHLPGMIGQGAMIISMRLIWTLMLGIYFGVMYKMSKSLWVPIITHAIINISGLAFCFTTQRAFPQISVIIIMLAAVVLGLWSVYYYFKKGEGTATKIKETQS